MIVTNALAEARQANGLCWLCGKPYGDKPEHTQYEPDLKACLKCAVAEDAGEEADLAADMANWLDESTY